MEDNDPQVTLDDGRATGFDDAWHDAWWRQMRDFGGNIIAAFKMRMVQATEDIIVMEMPYQPDARQGTGVFAAGAIIQLADVAATTACFEWIRKRDPSSGQLPFPLSVQISANLVRNTDRGKIVSETRLIHPGRRLMVAESRVKDGAGRLLAVVTTTHMLARV